jgi:hypothetical protein
MPPDPELVGVEDASRGNRWQDRRISTAAALRDLIMLRFVVAVENAEVPGFGLGG